MHPLHLGSLTMLMGGHSKDCLMVRLPVRVASHRSNRMWLGLMFFFLSCYREIVVGE